MEPSQLPTSRPEIVVLSSLFAQRSQESCSHRGRPMVFSLAEPEPGRAFLRLLPPQTKGEVRRAKVTDESTSAWKEACVFLCTWEGGRLEIGESHQCLTSQTRLNLNQKGRKPHGTTFLNVTNISFHPHSVFHSLFLLSSLTFLYRELEREKEQRELEIGLQGPLVGLC